MYNNSVPDIWELPGPLDEDEDDTKRPAAWSQNTDDLLLSETAKLLLLIGTRVTFSWTGFVFPSLSLADEGDWFPDGCWYMGLKWSLLELGFCIGEGVRFETCGLLKLLILWWHDTSMSSLLAWLGAYELLEGDNLDVPAVSYLLWNPWLLTGLLLPLTLLLDKWSPSYAWGRELIGRSTDDDALALAAALVASLESNFASFHALIRTGRWFNFFPLSGSDCTASGSTVDGSRPGSKCGIISSYLSMTR